MKILMILVLLTGTGLLPVIIWFLRQHIIKKLKADVFVTNEKGTLKLHVTSIKTIEKWILGKSEYEKVKRRMESKIIHFEPIIEDAQEILSMPKGSGNHKDPVFFTLFYPEKAAIGSLHNMIFYVHIEAVLEKIKSDADRFSGEIELINEEPEVRQYDLKKRRSAWLTRGTKITFVPRVKDIKFNPSAKNLWWMDDYNRASLFFWGGPEVVGHKINGEICIYVGLVEIAVLPFTIQFTKHVPITDENIQQKLTYSQCKMFRNIFTSFSRDDREVVECLLKALVATEDEVLSDCLTLRGEKHWTHIQTKLINRSQKFQLLWSSNAEKSEDVKTEWRHALTNVKYSELSIRPVYWNSPMPNPPDELKDLDFLIMPPKIFK